ncbi:MAG TPA: outer membrane protein assembly factor BamA [Bryobacteraceae bacterium]|nr:outer membrane protein assembly factor BamA [Bryobacteraceae bacterium]
MERTQLYMMFSRLQCLTSLAVCTLSLLGFSCLLDAQQPAPKANQPAQQTPPAQQKQNPFESVPQGKEPPPGTVPVQPKPGTPQLETPKPAEAPKPAGTPENVIDEIQFRGSRRVPQDTLRALIFTKKGDKYDEEALHRDFMALWNTGRFDDIKMEKEPGANGWIIRFVVTERRVVRSIKYDGAKSVTVSEILDRFKERKVGLSVESQYDPNKVQRAANVLKEYLSERGRQFATVQPDVRQIPPSSLEIVFKVNEGPKVKVGNIGIEGNKVFNDRTVIRAMKNLRPIGVPHSLVLENMFAKSFDSTKLEEDKDRIRNFYQEHGYFTARVVEHKLNIVDVGGHGLKIPLFKPNRPGKRANLDLSVEEGRQYRLNKINFVGVKLFRTPETLMRPLFQMSEGDIFSTGKLRKGMENMRKLYGEFGYIDFVPEPNPEIVPNSDKIDLTFNVDEGKQFFVRRIDFSGNTTTRDKVIRRELLIDEGDMYNTRLWDVSILRLNQLGYFEQLKEGEATTLNRDPKTNTVDLTLKVKERGKNSIQLNGGVSGISGSFIGFSYSTNNFLGLGETLSLDSQLGDRIRNVTFGFTEPYLFDKPMQAGFTIYTTRFNYDQGREVSLLSGRNLLPLFNTLGQDNLLNYVSNGYGFTTFLSYPLKRSFARLGLSYGYDTSNIHTLTTASKQYFEFINFQGVGGPNSLSGIKTSKVIPSYSYNTVNHPITPTAGKSLFFSTTFAGSLLGGNVNMIEPTVDAKYFRAGFRKGHVIGMHGLGRFVSGYGGKVAPPFNRFYMGGENDVRGFDIWGISPIGFIPSEANVQVLNNDGTARTQKVLVNGIEQSVAVTQRIPVYQLTFPGGDTQAVTNFEYRIPIFGPVILAAFFDAGLNKISRPGQLKLNPGRIDELNGTFPQAGFDGRAAIAPNTQKIRTSTGLELQVMMPVVNAPFRLYWAYNPTIVQEFLQPPIVADRSYFPNQATFLNSISQFGRASPFFEKRKTFRFSIGRTF